MADVFPWMHYRAIIFKIVGDIYFKKGYSAPS